MKRKATGTEPTLFFKTLADPTRRAICFDAARLYQVVFTAADPYVLGIGFAAWRDVGAFFRKAAADDAGTPNPIVKTITHGITRGISQSGNYLRGWLHLGFNQAEDGSIVRDGMSQPQQIRPPCLKDGNDLPHERLTPATANYGGSKTMRGKC